MMTGDGGAMTGKSHDRPVIADPLGAGALDFWLGRWVVSWAGGGHGTNTIRRILDGRAIEESFVGRDADSSLKGRSLSVRDAGDGRWRQRFAGNGSAPAMAARPGTWSGRSTTGGPDGAALRSCRAIHRHDGATLSTGPAGGVADVVVFIASDESRLMVGSVVVVDGGLTAH